MSAAVLTRIPRLNHFLALFVAFLVLVAPPAAAQQFTAFKQALAEGASQSEALSAFYRARDYEPLWTGPGDAERRTALLTALSRAGEHGLPARRYDPAELAVAFRAVESERDRGLLEAQVSFVFLRYARDIQTGILVPREIDSNIVRRVPRRDQLELIEEFAAADPGPFLRALMPQTPEYARLFQARQRLEAQIVRGGWGAPISSASLQPGESGDAVIALRNRLIAMGYMERTATTTFDASIQRAVQRFQAAHGLEPDGVVGRDTVAALNMPPQERLRSVIVAMERERWLNFDRGDRHIWVNLVDFSARIVDFDRVTFETRSIIGQQSHERQTPEFSDRMTYLEINPDWTVPRSMMARDYLPGMQANPSAFGQFQLVNAQGQVVDRNRVDFRAYSGRTFPFNLRQPPGPANPLGTVKFMFPNSYSIYLHDTPTRNLFSTVVRTHSNGCVRLQDPHEFAYELLSRQTGDPRGLFHRILNSGQQTRLDLAEPVPIHLVYRTAFTSSRGELQFRPDIYGRDALIFDALQRVGVALPGVQS